MENNITPQEDKIINLLNDTLSTIKLSEKDSIDKILAAINSIASVLYGGDKNNPHIKSINEYIKPFSQIMYLKSDIMGQFQPMKKALISQIEVMLKEVSIMGIRKEQKTSSGSKVIINNSNSQSQQQTQSVNIFLEAIKDELTGKQQKELETIAKEEIHEDEKRTKITDKIKSFGLDVATNIIANIVANPAIWG